MSNSENSGEEKIVYTSCEQNGCFNRCVLKVHVQNNRIKSIETDDTINLNNAREAFSEDVYRQGMVQARACVRGRGWRQTVYHPDRLLYPMKRVSPRGDLGEFERISWEEALDTVAEQIQKAVDKYGPYAFSDFYPGLGGAPMTPIIPWVGFGFSAWGMSSFSGHELAQLTTTGYDYAAGLIGQADFDGNEAPDLLNSKAIIMWGWDPAITFFEQTYYLMLAKEKGIPIIVIDPVYSVSAQNYATQWVPIRPGTDAAALLALAYVLFEENIYDHEYVSRFVEPQGFEEFRRYVLGEEDKIAKTPQWAEKISGVPAETLIDLARLIAKTKPTYFKLHWSVARKYYGENAARLGMYIPAMTGNLGGKGTFSGGGGTSFPYHTIAVPMVDWQRTMPTYQAPIAMNVRKLADAILLKEDLEKGKITEDEYRRHIGAPPEAPITDVHVASIGAAGPGLGASLNGLADINKQMRALAKMDFTFSIIANRTSHYVHMADLILPAAEPFFETATGYLPFSQNYMSNYFLCCFKAVEPPGEARPTEWIWLELAKRFGKGKEFNGRLYDVPLEKWDEVYDQAFREAYEAWAADDEVKKLVKDIPSWEKFKEKPLIRVPLKEAFYPHKEQIEEGKPFNTPSGKIEFAPEVLKDPEFPSKNYRSRCFGGAKPTPIAPIGSWQKPPDSPLSPAAEKYPIYVLTPHSHFRQHSAQDNNPWFNDEFRHAVWMSPTDAAARNIKDGDEVRVYSNKGEMILPAYVTWRVTPGTAVVRFGAWYTPGKKKTEIMPFGLDERGASNILTHDDLYPWVVGTLNCGNLVEIEKTQKGGF